ncbi:MAG: hypothetical protein JXA04_08055 [Gammaproteobacteria bacterium]|nr:hypothetical protein [Gammaproteobacteria bacterium]
MIIRNGICILLLLAASTAYAQNGQSEPAELQGIDDQVQTLKKEVIEINKELSLLEEKLLFPSTTQIAVFLSLQSKRNFRLDSVELTVDGQQIAKYIYTFRELEALQKGGVQRLHTGNVTTGGHKLDILIRGQTDSGNPFEKTATTTIDKKVTPKFVEMQVVAGGGEPRISFKDW